MQLAFLTILPSIFFSGYIFSAETMPKVFLRDQLFCSGQLFHQHHPRGDFARRGMVHLWPDALALFVMGTFLLIIAARRFQNKVIMA